MQLIIFLFIFYYKFLLKKNNKENINCIDCAVAIFVQLSEAFFPDSEIVMVL